MNTARLQKKPMTMRWTTTVVALAAVLLGAGSADAGDTRSSATTSQPPAVTSDGATPSEGPRIDRTRPGRRQPAFGLRRLTPPPAPTQPAPHRPM